MNETPRVMGNRNGAALIVVMGLAMLGTMAASSVIFCVGSRVRQAHKQVDLEQAFYIAEAGAERAASRVAAGDESSGTLTGNLGSGSYVTVINSVAGAGETQIDVTSVGTVDGVSHTVIMHGVRRVSWARYALWYDSEASKLWIVPGERFDGRVYSKPQFHFHNQDLATKGQVHFYDRAWTVPATIERASSAVDPIFDMGLITSAQVESMASVDFSALLANAGAGGLVLEGTTTIVLDNQTMTITNLRKAWSNKAVAIPANGTVYVKTVTTGDTNTKTGNITVSAPNGLGSRLTLISDNDINIVGHVRYKKNPNPAVTPNYPDSTDALGLIAKRSVVVQTAAPNNCEIYAHIMCQTGGFGVYNYNSGASRGVLTVYGGIVNKVRNAVGIVNGSGYTKNYIFDKRFAKNPPPNYPVLTDELEWTVWEG